MNKEYEDNYNYTHTITKEISRGGQGVVYRTTKPNIAIKVELDSTHKEILNSSNNEKFDKIRLLPIPLDTKITIPQATLKNHSGYVMSLLEDMEPFSDAFYKPSKELYKNAWLEEMLEDDNEECVKEFGEYIRTGGKRRRLLAYLKASIILSKLHASGLVYCDFSENNVFISSNQDYCNVWFIDADNLNYQSITQKGAYYTPGYAAPELYKGKGATMYSDVYSFAIGLFTHLTNTHPFKGEIYESYEGDIEDIEDVIYKGELPWILDIEDDSNNSDTKIPFDPLLSSRFIEIFNNTFCEEGKLHKNTRPTIFQWSQEIAKELDTTIRCNKCEMEFPKSKNDGKCPWCDEINRILNIKSYNYEKNNIIWEYSQEINKKNIKSIPVRTAQGYMTDYIDDILFDIEIKDKEIKISNFNDEFEFVEILSNNRLYGQYIQTYPLKLLCKDKKLNEVALLEVNII